jgi:hypothetical protein
MTAGKINFNVTGGHTNFGNVVQGDRNTNTVGAQTIDAPGAAVVDVKTELAALRELLAALKDVPDRGKLDRAMQDAIDEANKAEPDKEEVSGAVERAIKYAKSANDFGESLEKLLPRLTAIAAWVGVAGRGLLALAGVPA